MVAVTLTVLAVLQSTVNETSSQSRYEVTLTLVELRLCVIVNGVFAVVFTNSVCDNLINVTVQSTDVWVNQPSVLLGSEYTKLLFSNHTICSTFIVLQSGIGQHGRFTSSLVTETAQETNLDSIAFFLSSGVILGVGTYWFFISIVLEIGVSFSMLFLVSLTLAIMLYEN